MIGISCSAITYYFTVNLSSSCFSMFQFFQNEYSGSVSHDKTISVFIKRFTGIFWIFRRRKCCQVRKSSHTDLTDRRLSTAGNTSIQIAMLNIPKCSANAICSCCARSDNIFTYSLSSQTDCNITSRHITDRHRNKQRRHTRRSFFVQTNHLLLHCHQTANTGTYDHTDLSRILFLHI